MTVTISENLIRAIKDELAAEISDRNPFIKEDEKLYVRHDKIVFKRHPMGVEVEFYWRKKLTNTLVVPGELNEWNAFHLHGTEGRQEYELS